jgi:uncharacterized membrane protein YphA (DoxX/SURF4 family)
LPRFINSLFAIFSDKFSGGGERQANIADQEGFAVCAGSAACPLAASRSQRKGAGPSRQDLTIPRISLAPACLCVYHDSIMTLLFSGFLLALFGLSLILITLSLRLLRGASPASDSYSSTARFFLVALRLAIGWHCFVEGMEKINTPTWSSETYLRESVGPLSGVYRELAGDRLIAKATLGPEDSFPAELEREWNEYFDAFVEHYQPDAQELKRAEDIFEARKADTLTYLKSKTETVTKIAPYPPDLKLDMTMKQRLEEHGRLAECVRDIEAEFPTTDKDVHARWKSAKADLAKWRAEIKRSIDAQTSKLKKMDDNLKKDITKKIDALKAKLGKSKDAQETTKLQKEIDAEKAKLWEPLSYALSATKLEDNPMPEVRTPMKSWRALEISDFAVKWSLTVLGACLMLGFLSRVSSFATALLILTFYLAMPPLPGWPESPRLEGHYLLVNKTLIEVIALLALTFLPTGRWAGVDGLLYLCCCGGKAKTPPDTK